MNFSKFSVSLGLASFISIWQGLLLPKPIYANLNDFSVNTQEATRSIKQLRSELTALNVPNFQPTASFTNGVLQVSIPTAFLEGPVNEILRANEGRKKDTEFNKIDINKMRLDFKEGGFAVDGDWRVQHRERIAKNPFTKRWTHTSWVSVSGSFTQYFDVSVNNRRLNIRATKTDIRGADRWYGSLVSEIAPMLGVNGQVTNSINEQLQEINGMDVLQLMIQYGSIEAAKALGIEQNAVNQLLNESVSSLNAALSGDRLIISARIR
jgi:hypothetical protein